MNPFKMLWTLLALIAAVAVCLPPGSWAKDPEGRYVILVDPSHGGKDEGVKLASGLYEKDVTLSIARHLEKEFEGSRKIRIKLSRALDQDVPRADRVKEAIQSQADLFVSLHVNAGFEKESSGYEIYFQGFKPSAAGKKAGNASSEIVKDMVRTQHLNESVRFAKLVQKHMDKVFPRMDRGLREGPVLMLQGLNIPAVSLEIGFASNPKERKQLSDEAVQRFVGHALGEAVKEFF